MILVYFYRLFLNIKPLHFTCIIILLYPLNYYAMDNISIQNNDFNIINIIDTINKNIIKQYHYEELKRKLFFIKARGLSYLKTNIETNEYFTEANINTSDWEFHESNKIKYAIIPNVFTHQTSTLTYVFVIELHNLDSSINWQSIFAYVNNHDSIHLVLSSRISDINNQNNIEKFINTELETIPEQYIHLIKGIDFSEMHLQRIPPFIQYMSNLKIISLYKNNITHLLPFLLLNQITSNKIELLDLECNQLQTIDNLKCLDLKELNVKNNPTLNPINPELLDHCPNLQKLIIPTGNVALLNQAGKRDFSEFISNRNYIEITK